VNGQDLCSRLSESRVYGGKCVAMLPMSASVVLTGPLDRALLSGQGYVVGPSAFLQTSEETTALHLYKVPLSLRLSRDTVVDLTGADLECALKLRRKTIGPACMGEIPQVRRVKQKPTLLLHESTGQPTSFDRAAVLPDV
jgi:hypothetical protein